MALNQRVELRQGQSLVMTPQLQQAIKLLQLSRQELVEAINQEMEENPLLEEVSPDEDRDDGAREDIEENVVSMERENLKPLEHTEEINVEKGPGEGTVGGVSFARGKGRH